MSRVLLINFNRYAEPCAVFPLGLTLLNAALRQRGHVTRWLDSLADTEPIESALAEFKPDLVGISLRNIDDVVIERRRTFHDDLPSFCARIHRASPAKIILGGSGYSIFPKALLEFSGADFGIQGEGEESLLQLLETLADGSEYRSIPGLVYREGDTVRCNPQRPGATDSRVQPRDRPARLVQYYLEQSRMLNVQTQRGCGHACCYCTYPVIEGRRHRPRPLDHVIEELVQLAEAGTPYVFIVDSVFNSSPRHVFDFCEALRRRGLRLPWGCFLRPQGLTADQMQAMAEAGLSHVEFGSDSFSDRVLQTYDKRFTFEDILASAELARAARVEQCHFLILGGPGETAETLEETLAHGRLLNDAVMLPVIGMRIYPGTALHRRALAEKRIEPETDLLQPTYYVAPGLSADIIKHRLEEHLRTDSRWIFGEPPASLHRVVDKLRRRGVVGPLWTYFAMLQKFAPTGAQS